MNNNIKEFLTLYNDLYLIFNARTLKYIKTVDTSYDEKNVGTTEIIIGLDNLNDIKEYDLKVDNLFFKLD